MFIMALSPPLKQMQLALWLELALTCFLGLESLSLPCTCAHTLMLSSRHRVLFSVDVGLPHTGQGTQQDSEYVLSKGNDVSPFVY